MEKSIPDREDRTSNAAEGTADFAGLRPGITVIIPTFNREHLLKRAIKSVLNQTVKPDQIIVVDDGSTDGTLEMCRQFSRAISYVRQANAGVATARNAGIKLARHAWVAFLDSDDHWTPTHLERMKAAIEKTAGRARFYFSNIFMAYGTQQTTLWSQIGFKFEGPYRLLLDGTDWMLSQRLPASIQSSVFNAFLLKTSAGFDRRVEPMEDTELFFRLGIGGSVCAVNAVGCIYTADDDTEIRLTTKVNSRTENYWKCIIMLWSLVQSHFPHLGLAHREIVRYNLAESYWRLARNRLKAGRPFRGIMALLQSIKTQPSLPVILLRKKKHQKAGNGVRTAPEPDLEVTGTQVVKCAAPGSATKPLLSHHRESLSQRSQPADRVNKPMHERRTP